MTTIPYYMSLFISKKFRTISASTGHLSDDPASDTAPAMDTSDHDHAYYYVIICGGTRFFQYLDWRPLPECFET